MDELTEQLISPSACSTGRTDGRTPGKECPADATADAISCHLTRRRPSAFARRRVPRRTPKPGEEESAPVVVRVGRARAFGVGTDETRAGRIMYFERRERGASFLRSRSAVKSKRRQEEGGREEALHPTTNHPPLRNEETAASSRCMHTPQGSVIMQRLSHLTEIVLSSKINTRNMILLSFKDSPRKPLAGVTRASTSRIGHRHRVF